MTATIAKVEFKSISEVVVTVIAREWFQLGTISAALSCPV